MTKEVLLSLKGLQMEQGDGAEELETITPARYYHKNGSHYIVYEEMTEGFSDTTRNIIRVQDSCVEVSKKGLVNVRIVVGDKTIHNTPVDADQNLTFTKRATASGDQMVYIYINETLVDSYLQPFGS